MNRNAPKVETLEVLYERVIPSYLVRGLTRLDYTLEKVSENNDKENLKSLDELYSELKIKKEEK